MYTSVSVFSGSLPSGLSIVNVAANQFNLTGVPATVGSSSFVLQVLDASGAVGTSPVCPVKTVSPGCVSNGPASCLDSAVGSTCTTCPTCCRSTNPCFSKQCSMNLVLVLDNSASIRPFRDDVRIGVQGFINGMLQIVAVGGTANMGVVKFSTAANVEFPMTTIDPTYAGKGRATSHVSLILIDAFFFFFRRPQFLGCHRVLEGWNPWPDELGCCL